MPVSALTALRVLRAFRIVRLVKVVKSFRELFVLTEGLAETSKTLFWLGLILLFGFYIGGVFAVVLVGQNPNVELDPARPSISGGDGGGDALTSPGSGGTSVYFSK